MEAMTPHLVLAPDAAIDLQMHTIFSDGNWTLSSHKNEQHSHQIKAEHKQDQAKTHHQHGSPPRTYMAHGARVRGERNS